jgi:hypothetical protein
MQQESTEPPAGVQHTQYKGVECSGGTFTAFVEAFGKKISLGTFTSARKAARARLVHVLLMHLSICS